MANPLATGGLRLSPHIILKKYALFNPRAPIFWAATLLVARLLLKWRSSSKDKERKWPCYGCLIPTSQVTLFLVQPRKRQIPRHFVTSYVVTWVILLFLERKRSWLTLQIEPS